MKKLPVAALTLALGLPGLAAAAPGERGFQHGYLLAKEIEASLRTTRKRWEYRSGMDWPWLVRKAEAMFLRKIDPELLAELDGMVEGLAAAGVRTSRGEMIAYNGITELAGYWWPQVKQTIGARSPDERKVSCSSFIATGSLTRDGGIVQFVRMRRATQDASSIDEWCAVMCRGNNGGYANAWLVGDVKTGEIARLELGLKHVGFERTKDGYFVGSNLAENLQVLRLETSQSETDIRVSDVARRVRWKQLMKENRGRIDLEVAKAFEADHRDTYLGEERLGARSLCAHWENETGDPDEVPFNPSGTVDAKVVDSGMAKRMAFSARWGSACGTPFDAAAFLEKHPQFEWLSDILPSRGSRGWTEFRAGE